MGYAFSGLGRGIFNRKSLIMELNRLINVQQIRLIDVLIIAPFLMYAGSRKELPQPIKIGLWTIGVATLLYNGSNYLKNKQ